MEKEPQLLQHPNISKPMHRLSPRVLKGQQWWDQKRQEVYAEKDYHCFACNVYKHHAWPMRRLECHEDYEIDYPNGIISIERFVALCPACHKFIHSGRLAVSNQESDEVKYDIVQHGLHLLFEHNLYMTYATYQQIVNGALPKPVNFIPPVDAENQDFVFPVDWHINGVAKWNDWCMLLEGEKYYSRFSSYEEWQQYYANGRR